MPTANAHPIPDSISDSGAAMVETISVALNGVEKANLRLGSRVLIAGRGPVGLFTVQLCRAAGASEVGLVEPQQSRRAAAARFGATVFDTLDEAAGDVDAFIESVDGRRSLTNREPVERARPCVWGTRTA